MKLKFDFTGKEIIIIYMCGIIFTNREDILKGKFLKALECMLHRGPDAPLCYSEHNNFKLGHNRLKILDLKERSNQPFYSDDKRHVIIYNGEIYNYLDLAKEYDIELKTSSDTELILKLFLKLGAKKLLNVLNGMFTFIILDTVSQDFFVVRDRLGVKPLYFWQKDDKVIFASEISAIVELLNNDVKIDEIGLRQYKKLRTFFNNKTIYNNISMFPAGCYMENNKIIKYWELPKGYQLPPSDDELKELILTSIKYRRISDVPLGSYLSGGLDSTIVATLTNEPHTWTVGFADNNEFHWGQIAAKNINSIHHEVLVNKEMFLEDAKYMIKMRKEPLSVPNEVLLYQMTREVKKENTVVLSGEGADELFFGYDRIFKWASSTNVFNIEKFSELYSYGSNNDIEIVENALSPFIDYGSPLDIVAAFFQVAHLHGLLRRLDNSTMLCGVEAREPFVDYRLVERMAGVPFEYRTKNGVIKAPLKRIFADIIPKEIIQRKKVGFPVRLSDIFNVKKEVEFDTWFNFNIDNL